MDTVSVILIQALKQAKEIIMAPLDPVVQAEEALQDEYTRADEKEEAYREKIINLVLEAKPEDITEAILNDAYSYPCKLTKAYELSKTEAVDFSKIITEIITDYMIMEYPEDA